MGDKTRLNRKGVLVSNSPSLGGVAHRSIWEFGFCEIEAEGLGIGEWRQRGGESTSPLPPVKPYGPVKSYQPSAGIVVQPGPESRVLEVMTWNTSEPAQGSNVSHAERQFTEWYESQMKESRRWTDRVTKITIVVFGLDICSDCGYDLARLKTLVQQSSPNADVTFVRGDSGALLGTYRSNNTQILRQKRLRRMLPPY